MPRDYQLYLSDIQTSCEKIVKYTKNLSQDQFFKDEIIYDAVLRNLLVIGEAAKQLPEAVRSRYTHVEWKKICGLRDIIAHTYFGIDNSILWDVVNSKIPQLIENLKDFGRDWRLG